MQTPDWVLYPVKWEEKDYSIFLERIREAVNSTLLQLSPQYTYVKDSETYEDFLYECSQSNCLYVDFEFDDNKYAYGRKLALAQVSDGKNIWLIDILIIKNLEGFCKLLEDPNITKVFHSCKGDLLILDELLRCNAKNIEDTALMHKILSGNLQDISLKALCAEVLGIDIEKDEQKSNWLQRPLREKQLKYAASDVLFLPFLYKEMLGILDQSGRMPWYQEERLLLEETRFTPNENPSDSWAKKSRLNFEESGRLAFLWDVRDKIASSVDQPNYYIASNQKLLELSQKPPKTLKEWTLLTNVHALFRLEATAIANFFEEWKKLAPIEEEEYKRKKWMNSQNEMDYPKGFMTVFLEKEATYDKLKELSVNSAFGDVNRFLFQGKVKRTFLYEGADAVLRPFQLELLKAVCREFNVDETLMRASIHAYLKKNSV